MDAQNSWRNAAASRIRECFIADLLPDVVLVLSLFEGHVDDAVTSVDDVEYGYPTAAVLYDLIPLIHRQIYLADKPAADWYEKKVAQLRRADLLLSISESSRQEAIEQLQLPAESIVNISTAADSLFQPMLLTAEEESRLRSALNLRKPFVMYTGGADWRKNLPRLVAAYATLPLSLRQGFQLALVGRIPEGNIEELRAIAAEKGLSEDDLVITGFVNDDVLHRLYCLCHCFVFPSWHEGFGLPPLEAMSCGRVTIGANATSIPEVIGNEEALFDPSSTESLVERLQMAISDAAFRIRAVAKGLEQAQQFSWERTAEKAWQALEAQFGHNPKPWAWPAYLEQAENRQQKLIESIASISHALHGPTESDLLACARCIAGNQGEAADAQRACTLPEQVLWQIEGPFDTSYSLAQVNRLLSLAMDATNHCIALHSTEGPGDFDPDPKFLSGNPTLLKLYQRTKDVRYSQPHVRSRLLYPPRVSDMRSPLNLLHIYAWEESGFPQQWVDDFNSSLQGMTCLSRHVEKIMMDNGVSVPMLTTGMGTDHWLAVVADDRFRITGKGFRFLHVSSCFPRKGVDVLLAAYGKTFSATDDVTLVIKTFANPHNRIHDWLAKARGGRPDYPDVQVIETDLTDEELKSLYSQCHALVGPSRAEGFGVPFAEAMLSDLAVITTAWGGQLDFCTPDTSWLVDYDFAPAQSHFNLFNSVWAEPKAEHLSQLLKDVHAASPASRQVRIDQGKALLQERFRWQQVAEQHLAAARDWAPIPRAPSTRIGWISTLNTRCGIASYSESLLREMPQNVTVLAPKPDMRTQPDAGNVIRCWEMREDETLFDLDYHIEQQRLDTVVVQFNYGFFGLEHLARFLERQCAAGRVVVVVLHSTKDPVHVPHKKLALLRNALAACSRLLVHGVDDLNRLKSLGLIDNVTLFPLGIIDHAQSRPSVVSKKRAWTIASYGFFLPHKGLLELIEATALLKNQGELVSLRMVNAEYPAGESRALIEQAKQKIRSLRLERVVVLHTDFLDDRDSLRLLSDADVIVFPYQETAESASAAVRYGIATGNVVAVTPLPIFNDLAAAVTRLPGTTPKALAAGLMQLMAEVRSRAPRLQEQQAEASRWRDAHSYRRMGLRLHHLLIALRRSQLMTRTDAGP